MLHGWRFLVTGTGVAGAYAGRLLHLLGAEVARTQTCGIAALDEGQGSWNGKIAGLAGIIDNNPGGSWGEAPVVVAPPERPPAQAWAESGLMALSGDPDGPPLAAPGWTASYIRGAGLAVSLLARVAGARIDVDGLALAAQRAALAGLRRAGHTSVGGACRLLRSSDGWLAVSLARPDDFHLLPAWVGDGPGHPWERVAAHVASVSSRESTATAQLLGLAAAPVGRHRPRRLTPWHVDTSSSTHRRPARPVVLDLSSLWAGPLASELLRLGGARVIKVESVSRPDGARRGSPAFFDALNAGKERVVLDLEADAGRQRLVELLHLADLVVESSRPRVMRHWGIDVEALVQDAGLTWIGITGYGRKPPNEQRVAFGDDAAAAAGVVSTAPDGDPRFCGDALADPVTGLHAAVAGLAAMVGGGAHLIDVALADVSAHLLLGADAAP